MPSISMRPMIEPDERRGCVDCVRSGVEIGSNSDERNEPQIDNTLLGAGVRRNLGNGDIAYSGTGADDRGPASSKRTRLRDLARLSPSSRINLVTIRVSTPSTATMPCGSSEDETEVS